MTTVSLDELTYAGSFAVDSGQAMVGDPCYLDEWQKWESSTPFDPKANKGQYGYLGACEATLESGFGQLGSATSVVFSTGYGDGLYPVYVKLNGDGRVGMVVIDFDGELGDEE